MMKRWNAGLLSLALILGMTAGCSQKCFISEKSFYDSHLLPAGLEEGDPSVLVSPNGGIIPAPPNVDNPDRPVRPLSLQEAIALGLENGATGARNGGVNTPGTVDDSPAVVTGGSLNGQSDRVRVLALQPAVAGSNIEAALSRFDAMWVTGTTWSATDELLQGLTSFNNGTKADVNTSIIKAFSAGGVGHISFDTSYTLLSQPPAGAFGVINPNYTARLIFGIEQPLLRFFGSEYNQLLPRQAQIGGSTAPAGVAQAFNNQQSLLQSSAGQPLEGILITRLRFDQQRAEFERQMHNLLLNVEVAYWKLYEAYGALYSNEEVLRVLHKTWIDNYYKAQSGQISQDILAQIRGQYEEFRGERTNSLGAVLEAERNLRGILGLPAEDGTRLVPVTPPTLAPYQPNWEAALTDALIHRPDLVLARENLRFHQLVLIREKNYLQPDLRFVAQYSPVGFGTTLTGSRTFIDGAGNTQLANAFRELSSDHFNNYSIGLNLSVPLGYRFENAAVRSAKLQLAQAFYVLKDQEDRVRRTVAQQYQELTKWYRLIEDRRAERRSYADALEKKFKLVELGKKAVDLDLLDVQRRLALAFTKEYQAIAEYNNTLARMEFARGTIMQANNVIIAEGALSPCAQVRAVDHERERSAAFKLREKPNPMAYPGMVAADGNLPDHLDPAQAPPRLEGVPTTEPVPPAPDTFKAPPPKGVDLLPPPRKVPDAPVFKPSAPNPEETLPHKEPPAFPKKLPSAPLPLPDLSGAVAPAPPTIKNVPPPPVDPSSARPALPPAMPLPDVLNGTDMSPPPLPAVVNAPPPPAPRSDLPLPPVPDAGPESNVPLPPPLLPTP
jgi:outer membrane protein TolC